MDPKTRCATGEPDTANGVQGSMTQTDEPSAARGTMRHLRQCAFVLAAIVALTASLPLYEHFCDGRLSRAAGRVAVGMTRVEVAEAMAADPCVSGIGFIKRIGYPLMWDADYFSGPMTPLRGRLDTWLDHQGWDRWRTWLGTPVNRSHWAAIVVYDDDGRVHMVVANNKTIAPEGEPDPAPPF